jgi:broad specificity phosphatase PhoE
MSLIYFITHPEVQIDSKVPVPQWPLSEKGIDRIRLLITKNWVQKIRAIYSSSELKAIDCAKILGDHLYLPFTQKEEFGENDRSSTGYLPKEAFETMATRFFNNPTTSVEGWERAVDAQSRIVEAVNKVMDDPSAQGDIAIVSHGSVGTLLLCYLSGSAINRSMDQPGGGGGNVFCFEKESRTLIYNWKSIEES